MFLRRLAGTDRAFRVFSVIQDQQSRELSQGHVARRAKRLKVEQAELKLPRVTSMDACQVPLRLCQYHCMSCMLPSHALYASVACPVCYHRMPCVLPSHALHASIACPVCFHCMPCMLPSHAQYATITCPVYQSRMFKIYFLHHWEHFTLM